MVDLAADGAVRAFVEKPAPGAEPSNLINAGTYVMEPSVLDLIEPGRRVSVERDTFPKLVAAGRLAAMATDDYWIDTGTPELYLEANIDMLAGRRVDHGGDGTSRTGGAIEAVNGRIPRGRRGRGGGSAEVHEAVA